MKIIVEGFDGSGKSTLCERLSSEFKLPIRVAGGPPKDHDVAQNLSLIQLQSKDVIWDRITPISEMAYKGLDNIPRYVLNFYKQVIGKYIQEKTIFIWCNHIFPVHIIKDHDTKEHLEYINTQKENIIHRYNDIFSMIPYHLTFNAEYCIEEYIICQIKKYF